MPSMLQHMLYLPILGCRITKKLGENDLRRQSNIVCLCSHWETQTGLVIFHAFFVFLLSNVERVSV